jgi:hypothetical protein
MDKLKLLIASKPFEKDPSRDSKFTKFKTSSMNNLTSKKPELE